jgi:hypothetical protein
MPIILTLSLVIGMFAGFSGTAYAVDYNASISGIVTDGVTPIVGIMVSVYVENIIPGSGEPGTEGNQDQISYDLTPYFGMTDADGRYTVDLPAGEYRVGIEQSYPPDDFEDDGRYYSNAFSVEGADIIIVGSGENNNDIDIKLKRIPHDVKWEVHGGSDINSNNIIVVGQGATVGTLPVTLRSGYNLLGWFTEVSGGTKITSDTIVTGDVTYHAQWIEIIDINAVTVSSIPDRTFTGSPISPAVDVSSNGTKLILDTDYKVDGYANNTNAGQASVTISGIGNYEGSRTVSFNILPASVSDVVNVAVIENQVYNGKAKQPAVNATFGSIVLVSGVDYTVKYSANKAVGKASLSITGIGNYAGDKSVSFKIIPAKSKVSKLAVGKKQLKATWKKVAGTTKYQLRYRAAGTSKWKTKNASGKVNTLKLTKLKKGKKYQVQVRSYKTVSKVKYYSEWSAVKTSQKVK